MMLAASRLTPLRGTVGKLPVHPAPQYSPLLSNVYLHYVFDLWIKWWRESRCHGDMIVVRYADDFVIGFEHRAEAEACLDELRTRFAKFGLKLHDGKTRLLEFGRFAETNRRKRGEKRPETFDFLGFTHKCARTRSKGSFTIHRHSIAKRMRATLQAIRLKLRKKMHLPLGEVGCARLDELSCSARQHRTHRAFRR
jgi:hypothetical protein